MEGRRSSSSMLLKRNTIEKKNNKVKEKEKVHSLGVSITHTVLRFFSGGPESFLYIILPWGPHDVYSCC